MKTVKQIADELGVSKQAVFYRIKRPPLSNTLQSLTSNVDGVLMVSFDGETLIKQAFHADTVKPLDVKEPSKENTSFDGELIAILREQLAAKDEQLAALNKQLLVKDEQISFLQQNTTTAQALHAGTIQQQITDGTPQETEKKKWWSFGKRTP